MLKFCLAALSALSLSESAFALVIPGGTPVYTAQVDYDGARSPINAMPFHQESTASALFGMGPAQTGSKTGMPVSDSQGNFGLAFASADRDSLKGFSSENSGTSTFATSSKSAFTLPDLVFAGSGTMVSTSINVHLDGTLAVTTNSGSGTTLANASVGISYTLLDDAAHGNALLASGSGMATLSGNSNNPFSNIGTTSGFLTGAIGPTIFSYMTSINNTFTTDAFTAPTGRSLSLTIELDTGASGEKQAGANFGPNSTSDFSNTLTFATTGPAFNNPANDPAFTAASVQGGIVQVTPEPASLSVLLAGGLLLRRRR